MLYSARQGQPSFAAFDSALESDLNQRLGGQLDLYREYLDNGRFALTDEYLGTFRTYLRDKYRDRPDVVVAVALAAVDFLNQYRRGAVSRDPVSLCCHHRPASEIRDERVLRYRLEWFPETCASNYNLGPDRSS